MNIIGIIVIGIVMLLILFWIFGMWIGSENIKRGGVVNQLWRDKDKNTTNWKGLVHGFMHGKYTYLTKADNYVDVYKHSDINNQSDFYKIYLRSSSELLNINSTYFAYQNELYAICVNGKWLFKYGVTTGRINDIKRENNLWIEYMSHMIPKIISNVTQSRFVCTSSPLHFTHSYNTVEIPKKGFEFGSWLHVMEMAGHKALVHYLQNYVNVTDNIRPIVLALSDNCFKFNNKDIVDEYKRLLNENNRVYADQVINFVLERTNIQLTDNDVVNLLSEFGNKTKWDNVMNHYNINDEAVKLAIKSEIFNIRNMIITNPRVIVTKSCFNELGCSKAEFFCPLTQNGNINLANIRKRNICLFDDNLQQPIIDINKELPRISDYIVNYQKMILKEVRSDKIITNVTVFKNNIVNENNNISITTDNNRYVQDPLMKINFPDKDDNWNTLLTKYEMPKDYDNVNGAHEIIMKQFHQ